MSILRKLITKPWLAEQARIDDLEEGGVIAYAPPAKVFVWFFMLAVGSLFGLLFFAYHMRNDYADWVPLAEPSLLWINTVFLVLASAGLQWALNAVRQDDPKNVTRGLLFGGVFTFGFVIGQMMAWEELSSLGYFASRNPANAFFYLITGLHAVHILGGLVAWAVTAGKAWNGVEVAKVATSVELCTQYWHFLLLIWIVMFGLMITT